MLDDTDNEERLTDRLSGFVGKLALESNRRVRRRINIERRWIDDIRQYNGRYSIDIERELKDQNRSQLFLNLTRPKTNAMIARISDLLFPTDDKNWSIEPTPVPDMDESAIEANEIALDAREAFAEKKAALAEAEEAQNEEQAQGIAAEMEGLDNVLTEAEKEAERLNAVLNEAKARCRLMQEEIDDQLTTTRYNAAARQAIRSACKIGSGILKGPILGDKLKQRWTESEEGGFALQEDNISNMPGVEWVDPWGFFPDPDQPHLEDSDGFFQRHLYSKKKMRKMARRGDIDENAVRRILTMGSHPGDIPSYLTELRDIGEDNQFDVTDMYVVWEYTGPIDHEDLQMLGDAFDEDMPFGDEDKIDILAEYQAKVWFCQGEVLGFGLHPLDSQEEIYSLFTIEEDETSPFGYGIPYLMRDNQSAGAAAWRMIMDNASLSCGPQIVVDTDVVEPFDRDWKLKSMKMWKRKSSSMSGNNRPFETYNIEMHQGELAAIIDMARQFIDEDTSTPAIAQGEQGSGVTKTAQGMALLMNSANVVFRRIIKNWDDFVTVPMIRRFYHWNMQFSNKEGIKGDYDVDARGSSVLLVREMQANNLMMLADRFGDHPRFGDMIKHLGLFRAILRAHMISADEVTVTDQEYKENQSQGQEDPAAMMAMAEHELHKQDLDLKRHEIDVTREIANLEWSTRRDLAELAHDAKMQTEAGKLDNADREMQRKDRNTAVEVAMKQRTGDSAGGSI